MAFLIEVLTALRRWAQVLGPYVIVEILLPGGTLFALLLFLYRRKWAVAAYRIDRPKRLERRPFTVAR
jgi:hypothetical protein